MQQRFENKEIRDHLQREEDLRAMELQRQEDLRALEARIGRRLERILQRASWSDPRKEKEVTSSDSSTTPGSSEGGRRSYGRRTDEARREQERCSASARKRQRVLRTHDKEARHREDHRDRQRTRDDHEVLDYEEDRYSDEDREAAQTRKRHGSPRQYRMKYLGSSGRTPFSRATAAAPYPRRFDLADLPKYDGTQDPCTHLETFKKLMWVRSIEGPVILRLFSATLTGPAHKWLSSLPNNSIRDFEDLARKFELHFATSKKHPKSQFTLSKVKQKKGETLQEYLDRFRDTAMQVRSLSEGVHVHCLVNGLDAATPLARSLCKNRVYSLTGFYTRAKKYLDIEQMELANADEPEKPRNRSPEARGRSDKQRPDPR